MGPASAASSPVTPSDVPDAPTGVTATAGAASASVAFTAPASNGSAITGYTVTATDTTTPANGGQTASGASSPITVNGLTNGDAYTFTVTATNGNGAGAASSASSPVTPSDVPSAPTGATATAGAASASVAFTAPASNGGSPILSYTATCVSSNGGVTKSATHTGATATPITVTGLTTGKAYTCSVAAINSRGTGLLSAASLTVVVGAPAPPTGVTVTRPSAGHLRVAFSPGANNGSPITSYTGVCTSSNGGLTGMISGTGSPLTVASLTVGDIYRCTVVAVNGRGTSLTSSPSAAMTA